LLSHAKAANAQLGSAVERGSEGAKPEVGD
jgi:hypothetical protein